MDQPKTINNQNLISEIEIIKSRLSTGSLLSLRYKEWTDLQEQLISNLNEEIKARDEYIKYLKMPWWKKLIK